MLIRRHQWKYKKVNERVKEYIYNASFWQRRLYQELPQASWENIANPVVVGVIGQRHFRKDQYTYEKVFHFSPSEKRKLTSQCKTTACPVE